MQRLIMVVIVLSLSSSCATRLAHRQDYHPYVVHPTLSSDPAHPCDIPVAPEVELTAESFCVLNLHKARCNQNDVCIVDCIANAKALLRSPDGTVGHIGGGCWHVCFAYTGIDWTTPDGMDKCTELRQSP